MGAAKKQGDYESLCEEKSHSLNFEIGEPYFYPGKRWTRAVVFKNVVPNSAASVSPENLLETQIHRPHPYWSRTPEGEAPNCAWTSPSGNPYCQGKSTWGQGTDR